jgi:hypothetical protein
VSTGLFAYEGARTAAVESIKKCGGSEYRVVCGRTVECATHIECSVTDCEEERNSCGVVRRVHLYPV